MIVRGRLKQQFGAGQRAATEHLKKWARRPAAHRGRRCGFAWKLRTPAERVVKCHEDAHIEEQWPAAHWKAGVTSSAMTGKGMTVPGAILLYKPRAALSWGWYSGHGCALLNSSVCGGGTYKTTLRRYTLAKKSFGEQRIGTGAVRLPGPTQT